MRITKLSIENFRNFQKLDVEFSKGVTILFGDNGQGKTNLVESIYSLAKTNSFRTYHRKELIYYLEKEAMIKAKIEKTNSFIQCQLNLTNQGKTCFLNKNKVSKVSEYLGNLNAICFTPEDISIFKDSPRSRRWLLDSELSSLFPLYIKQLIVFQRVLNERNALLKQKNKINYLLLETLDEKLIECSYDLFQRRKWLVEKISLVASDIYFKITKKSEKLEFVYKTFLEESDKLNYVKKAKEILKDNYEKDMEKTFTQIGVHKDDFITYLNEKEVGLFASQGQQRLIALSMKLAIAMIVTKVNKEEPILILDDAFSELDQEKKEALFEYITSKEQVFITCTNYLEVISKKVNIPIEILKIQQGKIVERRVLKNG